MKNKINKSNSLNSEYRKHILELSDSIVESWHNSIIEKCKSIEPLESKSHLIREIALQVVDLLSRENWTSEQAYTIGKNVAQLNLLNPEYLSLTRESFLSKLDQNLSDDELFILYRRFFRLVVDIMGGYVHSVRENILAEQHQILTLIEKAKNAAENAKLHIEKRNNLIIESIPEIIIIIDNQGNVVYYHAGFGNPRLTDINIEGLNISSIIPKDLFKTFTEASEKAHLTGKYQVITTSFSIQNIFRYFEARIVPYEEDKILAVIRDITDMVESENEIKTTQNRLQEMTRQLISAQEFERHQIALELHDQILSQLGALLLYIDDTTAPKQFLDNFHKLIEQIRTTIYNLRPPMLNYGLYPAIEDHLGYLTNFIRPSAAINFNVPPSTLRFDSNIELHLFRIIQEALSNAIKHSKAERIVISGNIGIDEIWFSVEDNGIGMPYSNNIDLSKTLANNHFGLAGMFERAVLIGGELFCDSFPGQGTKITIKLKPNELIS